MTFEEILPKVKKGAKIIRTGWSGAEEYVKLIPLSQMEGENLNPYFVIKVRDEGYSVFQPSVCDILADDWVVVDQND